MEWQSPLHSVSSIKSPLLVYQGGKDDLIRQSQADSFVAACRAQGVAVDYLLSPDGGHGFPDPRDEQAVYLAIERFLAKHLGGMTEGMCDSGLDASISRWRACANVAHPVE